MVVGMMGIALAIDNPDNPPAGGDQPAASTKGSIIVKPSPTVPLTDKTLKAYKILNATYGTTGTLGGTPAQAVAYTIPASMVSFFNSYKEFATGGKTATENAEAAGVTLDVYVTNIMKDWENDSAKIKDFSVAALAAAKAANISPITGEADGANVKFANLDAGYYVIEDEGEPVPLSALMLDTVTNSAVEITLKASDDTEKVIMTPDELVKSKANELGLGRAVNYKITQKIPDTTGYDYYYYMINDTLSTGLTFNPETVKVTVGGTELTEGTDYHLYYVGDEHNTTAALLNGKTFIVAFDDVVADIADETKATFVKGAAVEVTYTATVNSDAVVGVDPNNNKVNVTFSNNPDKDGKGDYDNDHPGIPKNDGNHPTGDGPDKFTVTYTTQVKIIKQDKDGNKLKDVEFTLTGTAKDAVFNAEEVFEIDPTGEYWLLNNGKYTTTAPQTEVTLEETKGGAGWVEMVSGDTYEGAEIRVIGTKKYRPYVEATDSAKTRYVIIEPNDADYASITTKYKKVKKTATEDEEYDVARTEMTDANGVIEFSQLGAGTYKLSETGVLPGYNGLADIEFKVAVTTPTFEQIKEGNEKATWTVTPVKNADDITYDQENGTFKITIVNNQGTELPSTGGIGTTIFYLVGAALVLGAGVLLVTKRKMAVK